jgi:AcrR family transcriptional regulator
MAAANPVDRRSGATDARPRPNAERSAETRSRLIAAATASLVERGYTATTAVEVCARAGLTRGAYNHHYAGSGQLFADVLETIYAKLLFRDGAADGEGGLEALVREGWRKMKRPEFKAVIELWLASRNDPALGASFAPLIARLAALFAPSANTRLARLLRDDPAATTFFRLARETMIGLALGRATSPGGKAVKHEKAVVEALAALAREHDRNAGLPSS